MTTPAQTLLRHLSRLVPLTASDPAGDPTLLGRFVTDRDETAFAALVARHGPMVLRVCRRVLGAVHDAEDAFQATFLVLARKAATIRPRETLAAWLHGVALRVAWKARAARGRRLGEARRVAASLPDPQADPLAQLSARELLTALDEEVRQLPGVYRLPVILCCLEGKTQAEAARQLGWTPGAVKGRLERGRARLHKRLTRRGLTLSTVLAAIEVSRSMASGTAWTVLAASTVRAATACLLNPAAGAKAVSAEAAALAEEVVRGVAGTNLNVLGRVLLMVGLVLGGAGLVAHQPSPTKLSDPTPKDKGWTQPRPAPRELARTDRYGDPLPPGALARVGTVRLLHSSQFNALVYSPDGKTVAACGYDSHICLWDTATGKELQRFQGQKDGVFSLAFSPHGKLLVASGWGNLMVWRLAAPPAEEPRQLPAAGGGSEAIAFSPDGKLLAVATKDHLIRLWEVDPWREVRQLSGHRREREGELCPIVALAFLRDGRTLFSASQDDSIREWGVVDGKQLRVFADRFHGLWAMALSPDGRTFATAEGRNLLRLWETATGREISQVTGSDNSCYCLAFSADGRTLASAGSADHVVRFWDMATGKEQNRWTCSQFISRLAFAPSGPILAVGGSGVIRFREAATGKDVLPLIGPPDMIRAVAFTLDGKALMTSSVDGAVGLWEAATGKQRGPFRRPPRRLPNTAYHTALARDGRVAASMDAVGKIYLWDVATGQEVRPLRGPPAADDRIVISADGRILAAVHRDKFLRLWEASTGKLLWQAPLRQEYTSPFTFSPDGAILMTAALDCTVRLWDTTTGQEIRVLRWPGGTVQSAGFSPDGKLLATGHSSPSERGTRSTEAQVLARVWDVATGRELRRLKGPPLENDSIAISPDGKSVATGHFGEVYLWEVASGQVRRHWEGHLGAVMAVTFSPDGRRLASGSSDRTALVWDVTDILVKGGESPGSALNARLESLWDALVSPDGPRAFQALWELVAAARYTVPFFKKKLLPVLPVDGPRVARLLTDLENERFAVRQNAARELEQLSELAEPALQRALQAKPSLEKRQRVEQLLARLASEPSPEALRALRAVEVLEQIDSLPARQLLAKLAEGAPESRLTQEAKASLERLARRVAVTP